MCLPIAVKRPDRVTGRGEHLGFEWMVLHNESGYRCGYVRVMPGHPWHGLEYDDARRADGDYVDVHGGLTFAAKDQACDKPGPDDGWWLGFDCAHAGDASDPTLPSLEALASIQDLLDRRGHVWTQEEVEAECRRLCEQAAEVGHAVTA